MFKDRAHFLKDYTALRRSLKNQHPDDVELAMAKLIGSPTVAEFRRQGDQQADLLRKCGLVNGMSVYDLGCGSGRATRALMRSGWTGNYKGADIVPDAVAYLRAGCPGYEAFVWTKLSINAPDASLDMVWAFSVFTHLMHEETYIYLEDIRRSLNASGILVFSFLEFEAPIHWAVMEHIVAARRENFRKQIDMFLHREQIAGFLSRLGYGAVRFINGADETGTSLGLFGQSVCIAQAR